VNPAERKGHLSAAEVARIFKSLGLATQEQRDNFLLLRSASGPAQRAETCYVTRLSNSSEPASAQEG
jgi:hypothetical protein